MRNLFERETDRLLSVKNFSFSAFSAKCFLTDLQKPHQKGVLSPRAISGNGNTKDSAPGSNGVLRNGCRRG